MFIIFWAQNSNLGYKYVSNLYFSYICCFNNKSCIISLKFIFYYEYHFSMLINILKLEIVLLWVQILNFQTISLIGLNIIILFFKYKLFDF